MFLGVLLVLFAVFVSGAERFIGTYVLLVVIIAYSSGVYTYISRTFNPPRVLELRPDSVILYEKGRGPVADIPFTRDVEVDVHMRDDPAWKGHLMLMGWTFRKGNDLISLHPDDNWDLWELQDLSAPILWVVDKYEMRKGEELKRYISKLGSAPKEAKVP
jgi:hypothetical protein